MNKGFSPWLSSEGGRRELDLIITQNVSQISMINLDYCLVSSYVSQKWKTNVHSWQRILGQELKLPLCKLHRWQKTIKIILIGKSKVVCLQLLTEVESIDSLLPFPPTLINHVTSLRNTWSTFVCLQLLTQAESTDSLPPFPPLTTPLPRKIPLTNGQMINNGNILKC